MRRDGICYFPPAGGGWNLAHICGLLPESHALFVVPMGCGRIIQLTALETGMQGRFSLLRVTEPDLISGGIEDKTLQAAREVLERVQPRALLIFTSCIADFVGLDRNAYLEPLRQEFPQIPILDGRMDPINRQGKLPPIPRMHKLFASVMEKEPVPAPTLLCSGSFWPPEKGQELLDHLMQHGVQVGHLAQCTRFDEARALGGASFHLVLHPAAVPAAKDLEQRLGMPWINLSACKTESDWMDAYRQICKHFGINMLDFAPARQSVERAANALLAELKGRFVDLDDSYCPDISLLTHQLLALGIPVRRVFVEGGADLEGVSVINCSAPEFSSSYSSGLYEDPSAVCAGEVAAYAAHSPHYCSGLRFSGRFGLHGLRLTLEELTLAAQTEQPLRNVERPGRRFCTP